MLVSDFAFFQSGLSVADPPHFSLGKYKLRTNKKLRFDRTWSVPGSRQQNSDIALFLLSGTDQNHRPALGPKCSTRREQGSLSLAALPSRGEIHVS